MEPREIDSRSPSPVIDRREILHPAISNVVSALGGFELSSTSSQPVYKLGDSCLGCLRDLKKFWRKDDTDDDRNVARIFWECRVLNNDLVPILLETAGKGKVEDKCAIACADLITAMTWPIDLAEELRELDEEPDSNADYTTLIQAQRSYKASMLTPGALKALFDIMIPSLAKDKRERSERDVQLVNVVLHAFRNLAFIKDPPSNSYASSDQAEFSSLQSKLLVMMHKEQILTLFLTLASNADDPSFNQWNALLLETFYLLFRSVKPAIAVIDPQKLPGKNLSRLLDAEEKLKREEKRQGASRHSRFGTTIAIKSGSDKYILHRQQAVTADPSKIMDMRKKSVFKKAKKEDDLGSLSDLNPDAVQILKEVAVEFLTTCFNPFLASLLKDIKAERPKITEKDNVRLLFVTRWFLEFFLAIRENEQEVLKAIEGDKEEKWGFGRVAEVVEKSWVAWILRRMRGALDDKPKQWTELQAGIECLIQLLSLIDQMSVPTAGEAFNEASQTLQYQLYYDGEILELAFETLKGYKEQSIAYLDSAVYLSHVLLKMLERWGKSKGEMYVRKRKSGKKKGRKGNGEKGIDDGVPSDEDVDKANDSEGETFNEHMFTFEKFESKFAQSDITHACLVYLARYKEFDSSEKMKRVVGLLHRQAVKAKAEGLFFQVSTLDLFNQILGDHKLLPKDQPHKDLISLINFVLRKFFKTVAENPMLIVEAFFPKNRNQWKQFSTWEEDDRNKQEMTRKKKAEALASKHPQDVEVKGAFNESEKVAIAVACLLEGGKRHLIDWVKEVLWLVKELKQGIVNETDGQSEAPPEASNSVDGEDDESPIDRSKLPSNDAMQKFEDYMIPYPKEEQAQAATKDPHLKLLFRLVHFFVKDKEVDELEWYIPSAILPAELQSSLDEIDKALAEPIDLEGKKATQMLRKKARPRARRTRQNADPASDPENEGFLTDSSSRPKKRRSRKKKTSGEDDDGSDSDGVRKKRKAKKKRELVSYKSAEYIQDSDLEDDEEFFRKEKEIREKAILAAEGGGGGNMMSTGTKKRKSFATSQRKGEENEDEDGGSGSARRKKPRSNKESGSDNEMGGSPDEEDIPIVEKPRPRPKPRRVEVSRPSSTATSGSSSPAPREQSTPGELPDEDAAPNGVGSDREVGLTQPKIRAKIVVFSDDDD